MRSHARGMAGVLALMLLLPATAVAQDASEQVMVAAAEWARGRLPGGSLRLDPHRTGREVGAALAERVARAAGAELGTLEETRRCADVMDPSTCRLESNALIAISAPRVQGDEATVRVYVWYRQSNAREPVAKASWDLGLRRTADGWSVVSGSTLF